MAEGCEEAENSGGSESTSAMLGAVMPCESSGPSIGVIKRELDVITSQTTISPSIIGSATSTTAIISPTTTITPTIDISSPSSQHQPINLKSEVRYIVLFVSSLQFCYFFYFT